MHFSVSESMSWNFREEQTVTPMPDHTEAIRLVLEALTNEKTGVVKSLDEIGAVGHRIVHGGEKFAASTIITDEVMKAIEECNDLAPLHNPANLIGINACKKLMPTTPMVAVFDTAFHQTMPEEAYMYGLPYEYYEKYKIRPSRGVRPMEVSTHLPFLTADTLAPLPRWQTMIFRSSYFLPRTSAAFLDT